LRDSEIANRHYRWGDGDHHPHVPNDGSSHPRGRERFKDSKTDLLDDVDIFSPTQPEAGADNIETNTFGATNIAQVSYS
jgi:hypothetical protein